MTPGPFRDTPEKTGPHGAFSQGEELVKGLAPAAAIVPYQRPSRSHADCLQEKRTGIYDTGRKGR
jgi:hypothetical protein